MTNPPLPRGLLTPLDARLIKEALWNGVSQADLAARFGVSQPTISRILRGKAWADASWPDGTQGPIALERKRLLSKKLKPSSSPQSPSPEVEEASARVQALLEQKESQEEAALAEAIKRPRGRRRKAAKKGSQMKNGSAPLIEWELIELVEEGQAVVELAQNDPTLQSAACTVLSTIPRDQWATDETLAIIRSVAAQSA